MDEIPCSDPPSMAKLWASLPLPAFEFLSRFINFLLDKTVWNCFYFFRSEVDTKSCPY